MAGGFNNLTDSTAMLSASVLPTGSTNMRVLGEEPRIRRFHDRDVAAENAGDVIVRRSRIRRLTLIRSLSGIIIAEAHPFARSDVELPAVG